MNSLRHFRGQGRHLQRLVALSALVFLTTLSILTPVFANHVPVAPATTNNNVTFQTSGQSMWGPASAPGVSNVTVPIISTGWSESGSKEDIQHVHVDVPQGVMDFFGIGDVDKHFGGRIGGSTSGQIGISARFQNVGSGAAAVTYPVQVTLTTPAANSFKPGQTVTIGSSVTLLPGWNLSTTPPQATVDIIGNFGFATSANTGVCFFDCANFDFFPPINIAPTSANIVTANSTTPVTITFLEGISGTYGLPNVATTASIAPDGKSLIASGSHKFVDLHVDLDKWVTSALGVPPPGLYDSQHRWRAGRV